MTSHGMGSDDHVTLHGMESDDHVTLQGAQTLPLPPLFTTYMYNV